MFPWTKVFTRLDNFIHDARFIAYHPTIMSWRKIRSISYNAKTNSTFVSFVEREIIPTNDIPYLLPDEMNHCGPHSIMKAQLDEKERVIEQWRKYWETEHENSKGMYTCKCCKSSPTVFNAVQTRSADEPMTVFITCLACNNRWKE